MHDKLFARFRILCCTALFSLVISIIAPHAVAADVTLAWDPNTEPDLAGYRLYYGTASRNYTNSVDVGNFTIYTITNLTEGLTYYFAATAYNSADKQSGYSNEVSYTVPPSPSNSAPTTPSVPSGPSSGLTGTALTFTTSATDPDGDNLQYRFAWGGGVVSAWGAASQTRTWTAAGQYIVKAQARDSKQLESAWSGGRTVTISANRPPTVNAGADQTVNAGASVALSGRGSDPDNGIAGWQWRQTGGTSVSLSGTATKRARFTAPAITSGSLNLVFEFKATDALGLSAADTCKVTVLSAALGGGEGVPNNQDAFPNDPAEWQDSDGDGVGDNADPPAANRPPAPPVPASPAADQITDALPTLKTQPFSDPDAGDRHAQTRWQVFRDEDSACVLDIRTGNALTRLTLPQLVLDEATAYFWRAQFIDWRGASSEWSNYAFFSVTSSGSDSDANGIPDSQEVSDAVDLDNDGVNDIRQTGIKSLKMEGTSIQIGVSVKESPNALGIEFAQSEAVQQFAPNASAKPANMPFGIISFKVAVKNPGDQALVKLIFSEPAPTGGKWYKYDSISDTWYDFSTYAEFSPDRRLLTLTLTDGGPGDADGVANGIIIDPSGLGVSDNRYTDDVSHGSGGSSSSSSAGLNVQGCFIDTTAGREKDYTLWALLGWVGFLILLSLPGRKMKTADNPLRVIKRIPSVFMTFVLVGILLAFGPQAALGQDDFTVKLYTADDPPPAPLLEALPLLTQITQHGITWTFSTPVRVGRFVNGDYYVVGEATVVDIQPLPTPSNGRHGSMLNIRPNIQRSGFDSRISSGRYDAGLRVYPPITVSPGNKLISSRSVDGPNLPAVMRPNDKSVSPVASVSILTSVSSPLPPDAFRPSYAQDSTEVYLSRNLRRHLLPKMPPAKNAPSIAEFEGFLKRPWVDSVFFNFDVPSEYMPSYGRENGYLMSFAGLLLALDHPEAQKEPLLVYLCQYGIDLSGLVQQGHTGWPAHGGHGSGRKFPIVFTGVMLNNDSMKSVQAKFGEDMQTIRADETPPSGAYTASWHTKPETVVYGGHVGINGEAVNPGWGPYEHLAPSAWKNTLGESYRRCCTSVSWVGEALAARLFPEMKEAWSHEQFFDYVDRWMHSPDDPQDIEAIRSATGMTISTDFQQGQSWRILSGGGYNSAHKTFVDEMWALYRNSPLVTTAPEPPGNLRVAP